MQILPLLQSSSGTTAQSGQTAGTQATSFAALLGKYAASGTSGTTTRSSASSSTIGNPLDAANTPNGADLANLKLTKEDIAALRDELLSRGFTTAEINDMEAGAESGSGMTWGQMLAKVQKKVSSDSSQDQREIPTGEQAQLLGFFGKLGFTADESQQLVDSLAKGETESVWNAVNAKVSGLSSESTVSLNAAEMASLARNLNLSDSAQSRISALFEQSNASEGLSGEGLRTAISLVQNELSTKTAQEIQSLSDFRQAASTVLHSAWEKSSTKERSDIHEDDVARKAAQVVAMSAESQEGDAPKEAGQPASQAKLDMLADVPQTGTSPLAREAGAASRETEATSAKTQSTDAAPRDVALEAQPASSQARTDSQQATVSSPQTEAAFTMTQSSDAAPRDAALEAQLASAKAQTGNQQSTASTPQTQAVVMAAKHASSLTPPTTVSPQAATAQPQPTPVQVQTQAGDQKFPVTSSQPGAAGTLPAGTDSRTQVASVQIQSSSAQAQISAPALSVTGPQVQILAAQASTKTAAPDAASRPSASRDAGNTGPARDAGSVTSAGGQGPVPPASELTTAPSGRDSGQAGKDSSGTAGSKNQAQTTATGTSPSGTRYEQVAAVQPDNAARTVSVPSEGQDAKTSATTSGLAGSNQPNPSAAAQPEKDAGAGKRQADAPLRMNADTDTSPSAAGQARTEEGGSGSSTKGQATSGGTAMPGATAATPVSLTAAHGTKADAATPQQTVYQNPSALTQQVGNGLLQNMGQGTRQVTLNLQPEDLGNLSVTLTVKEKEVRAVIKADSPETSSLLQDQVATIRKNLEDQGFKVTKLDVQTGLAQDNANARQGGAEQQAQARQQQENLGRQRSSMRLVQAGAAELAETLTSAGYVPTNLSSGSSGLDLFA